MLLKIGSVLVFVAFGILGFVYLSSASKESNKRDIKPEARSVTVSNIEYGDVGLEVSGNGVIEPKRELKIVSEASGQVTFAKNDLKNGTYVKEGETVVEIDPREVRNNLLSLRSDFLNSVAGVLPELKVENNDIYEKWNRYFLSIDIDSEVPPLPEVEESPEKIKISSQGIFSKYFGVKNQEILLSKHIIKAPFDGYITSGGIIKNSFLSKGQEVFTLSESNNLEIAVPLLVEEYRQIDFSRPVVAKIYPEKSNEDFLKGKVIRKDTRLERNSQSIFVYVELNNPGMDPRFLPGNYVHVSINGKTIKNAATLPRYLVDADSNIYTMEEGKLARHKVNIIAMQGSKVVIDNSLAADTRLVTTILQKPLVGMDIKVAGEEESEEKNTGSDTSKMAFAGE